MDKDLLFGDLGSVGKYDIAIKDGHLVVQADMDLDKALVLLEGAIPGGVDDVLINLLRMALKA